MVDEARDEHRAERISAAFALLTGKFEDAAELAVEGQWQHSDSQLRAYAQSIAALSSEAAVIARMLGALLADLESAYAERTVRSRSRATDC